MSTIALERAVADTVIDITPLNANMVLLENLLNGGLGVDNVSAAGFGSAGHGDLSAITDDFHTAESVLVVDTAGYYTAPKNVENILAEIGNFTGIGVAAAVGQYFIGQARDDSNVFPSNAPVATITVAANSAPTGIAVSIFAYIAHDATAAGNELNIPLNITNASANPGDLSASGSRNRRFELGFAASAAAHISSSATMLYLVAGDSWEPTIENTVKIGTPWTTGNMTAQNFGIIVWGLK